jgi:peptide-methionine (S)-S-oxide reductase
MHRLLVACIIAFVSFSTAALARTEAAIFAGGCFWCVEKDMDHVPGVVSTTSGYAGGGEKSATYKNHAGAVEAVKVEFDPNVISYDALVARFLRMIDVTDAGGQFCDRGDSYTSAIFTSTQAQKSSAVKAIANAEAELGLKLATPVKPFNGFVVAEAYHQNYYLGQNRILTRFGYIKQVDAYERYRKACGRDARVKKLWGNAAFGAGS